MMPLFPPSSSTLSPLAPPFSFDPPPPPSPPLHHRSPPFPSFAPGRNNLDAFNSPPEYGVTESRGPDAWRRTFDADEPRRSRFDQAPPWMESSSGSASSYRGTEKRSTFEDNPYGGWNGAYDNVWLGKGLSGSGTSERLPSGQTGNYRHDIYSSCNSSAPYLEPSTSFKKTFYSRLPNVTSGVEPRNSYAQNFDYEKYLAQFEPCLSEAAFHPTTSRSMSTQGFASSRVGASTTVTTVPKQGVHHRVVVMKPDSMKNSDARVHVNEKYEDNDLRKSIGASSVAEKVLLAGPARDIGSSTTKLNTAALKIKSLTPASPSSASGATDLDNSLKYSAEADSVDSPCWRGAESSRKSPFAARKTSNIDTIVDDAKYSGKTGQVKEGFSNVAGSSNMPNEGRKISSNSPLALDESSSVISSSILRKSEDSNEHGLNSKNETVFPDVIVEKMKVKEKERGPALQETGIHRMENSAANKIQIADETSNCTKGSDPLPNKNFKRLAKDMLNVSVDLLCTVIDVSDLEADALMPLIAARNNIDLILKDKIKIKDGEHGNAIAGSNVKQKRQSFGTSDESDLKESGGYDAHFRNINQMTKALENVMTQTFAEKEGNLEAVLYKNLWLEAEASNCKLKYEFKLALAKAKMDGHNLFPTGKPPTISVLSDESSMNELFLHETANAKKNFQVPSASHWNENKLATPHVQSSVQHSKMIEFRNLDSAMARQKTPMDLAGNKNAWGKNNIGIPNHESDGSGSEAREPFYGPMTVDANNLDLQDSATLAALGFTETTAGLYGGEKIWTPLASLKQLKEYSKNLKSYSSTGNANTNHVDGLPSYITERRDDSYFAAGYESPSVDGSMF